MHLVSGMIEEHLQQLRTRLEHAAGLPEQARGELLQLVEAVRKDVGLGDSGIAEKTDVSDQQTGLSKLVAAVDELEASHPDIAASINQVANTLARMGI